MQVTVNISDIGVLCLKHDLLDIEKWVQGAVIGKINCCKTRIVEQEQPKLIADPAVKSMPADENELIKVLTSHPSYENRVQRDAREEAERKAALEAAKRKAAQKIAAAESKPEAEELSA